MTLSAEEFIRRFLLHVLPRGFHHIRHCGFLTGSNRTTGHRPCLTRISERPQQIAELEEKSLPHLARLQRQFCLAACGDIFVHDRQVIITHWIDEDLECTVERGNDMLDAFRPAVVCDTVKCLVPARFKTGEHLTRSSTLSFGDRDAEKALEGWI